MTEPTGPAGALEGRLEVVGSPSEGAAEHHGSPFEVYADGACLKNPNGPGGWGWVAVRAGAAICERSGHLPSTSSPRAELIAIREGLRAAPRGSRVIVYSDSKYAVECLSGRWRVKRNKDLFQHIAGIIEAGELRVSLRWVRGHNGNRWNEYADELAGRAARPGGTRRRGRR